ncbi:hypothetical protein EOD39_12664 [Acipenser ruthenus]|uniref:Uncharacterized protein n=1 Tax=Acipenser ruthenus TaxID=7906 RepID=A0A444UKN9_ACIRT|nr:hypothetical protein EOD39_12664 [Acipenser ruthenus]
MCSKQPVEPVTEKVTMDCSVTLLTHDYCSVPEPAALDVALSKNEELSKEIKELKTKLEEMTVKHATVCNDLPPRMRTSDFTRVIIVYIPHRFARYRHLMTFWQLIEPSTAKIVQSFYCIVIFIEEGKVDNGNTVEWLWDVADCKLTLQLKGIPGGASGMIYSKVSPVQMKGL